MSDTQKGFNAFFERIPNQLQEKYFTDYMTEMLKLVTGEANITDNNVIPYKHGLIVAFARKT
jgi:hypothetical protein